MKVVAIIPTAGKGKRMGANISKQYLFLLGRPVLAHTVRVFEESKKIDSIVLVVHKGDEGYCKREIVEKFGFRKVTHILAGGRERQDSVRAGLNVVDPDCELVIIHDGVRPLIFPEIITESINAAKKFGASVVAVPVKDTVKEVSKEGTIHCTLPRENLWMVQTPQVFRYDIIREAHAKAHTNGFLSTDDSALVEKFGNKVCIVEGSYENIKLTTQEDMMIAEVLMEARRENESRTRL
ncbi:MAG: 2-C-methyl-D-erythritol 4-phosphate cytidylyltransferase [Thermodesulfobacteriota bacterium]